MKAEEFYNNINQINLECDCTQITGFEWGKFLDNAVKANKDVINKLVKKYLPKLYEKLRLDIYNPYSYLRTDTHLILVHANIEYFLKVN